MGGVPVLLMVTLFGTLSAQHHDGVYLSQTAKVHVGYESGFAESGFAESGDLVQLLRFKSDWTKSDWKWHEDRNLANELGAAVHLVADTSGLPTSISSSRPIAQKFLLTNDLSPVDIPEIRNDSAACTLNTGSHSGVITVRKPDNTGTAGSGFSLPSVPPSLAEAGQTLAQNVDRAGRPINPSSAAQGVTNGTTLPTTRGPQPFTVPPFTSTVGPAATSGASAPPISTREGTTRATNWGQFPLPTTAPTAVPAAVPAVPTSRPSGFNTSSVPMANAAVGPRSTNASPLLPTDTFGRTPAGLPAATAGLSARSSAVTGSQTTINPGTPGFVHVPSTDSIFSRNHNANNTTASNFVAGSTASRPSSPLTNTNISNSTGQSTNVPTLRGVPVGQPPIGRFGANPSASFTPPSSTGYPADATAARSPASGFSTPRPDARLSAAQVAAGAWSVDAFGQAVDRTGQRIASASTATSNQRFSNQQTRGTGATGFGNSFANQSASHMADVHSQAVNHGSAMHGNVATSGIGIPKMDSLPGTSKSNETARSSLASSDNNMNRAPEIKVIETESVTTQPLFNGLLLISLVANVYLIFWLKNLRLQYQEMVAAKRMASSNASAN